MINKTLLTVLIFLSVCSISFAQEYAALQTATAEELLLFWDAKDLYVETATRHFKPISQAAENISVVTAKDIEDMNAHTMAEVLSRVTGLFVDSFGQDFGSEALLYVQQTAWNRTHPERHVLVLLDGIPMNTHNSGHVTTGTIPVGIIDRLEIIKGPASSAWGSSLGGVINIITKKAGDTDASHGSVSASYGERNSQDYRAEMYGKAASASYYIFAGHKDSDGLRDGRNSQDNNFYAKLTVPVSNAANLGVTFGHSGRDFKDIDSPGSDIATTAENSRVYGTVFFNAHIMERLDLKLSFFSQREKFDQINTGLGLGTYGPEGTFVRNSVWIDKTKGGSGSLVYTGDANTIVLGADIIHGKVDQKIENGDVFQSWGAPATIRTKPDIDKWAVYINDTLTLGKLTVTPGLRYDKNSETGSFTSPSLGVTYKIAEKTLLRASSARGFTIPTLSSTNGGGWFFDPNPDLKPEKVWSYQGGIETAATDYVWLKAIVFHHDMKDTIDKDLFVGPPPAFNDKHFNIGKTRRTGYELEAETAPVYNTSLRAGFTSVRIKCIDEYERVTPFDINDSIDIYQYNIGIKYDDRKSLMAQLHGRYVWWDLPADDPFLSGPKYSNFIWDLNISKNIYTAQNTKADVFFAAHNIFSASHYTSVDVKNPQRWVEGGVRVTF